MKLGYLLLFLSSSILAQINPPGGLKLTDSLFLDKTEVANIHWLEYEYYVKSDSSETFYNSILPAQVVTENYRPDYFRHPAYRYHPVVGITYAQAREYCKWRTKMVNTKLSKENASYRVKYRLPSEHEWEIAARKLDSLDTSINIKPLVWEMIQAGDKRKVYSMYPDRDIKLKQLKKEIKEYAQGEHIPFVLSKEYPWFITLEEQLPQGINDPSYSFDLGYTHLIGNVAEMVAEPGIVKGGSWRHKLSVSFPSKRIQTDPKKAYDWVGFRCIAEIVPIIL
ncbi:MAG: SUMF1/EgtB/PvdO family nonheme iron enzyme [Ekhidna sp.]|uniref:formylglycine-generating enzyme family protein n=1 Tax=Ekhidna sp. TaxID=2608089 RepID=UPI0032EDEF2C